MRTYVELVEQLLQGYLPLMDASTPVYHEVAYDKFDYDQRLCSYLDEGR